MTASWLNSCKPAQDMVQRFMWKEKSLVGNKQNDGFSDLRIPVWKILHGYTSENSYRDSLV